MAHGLVIKPIKSAMLLFASSFCTRRASFMGTLAGFLAGSGLAVVLPQPACLLPHD